MDYKVENINRCLRNLEGAEDISAYDYQVEVARHLFDGKNVLLRVPTGCGKTWSAVIPFLISNGWENPPHRLIYVLPVRTLIDSIAALLREKLPKLDGWQATDVTVQTGVTSEDPFLDRGRIIVTTFDQVLSGLLGRPYSLGPSLHNVNSAALHGCLVVFDEFHLMPPGKAFMTAIACCRMLKGLCQSVWMTATATEPLCEMIIEKLEAVNVELSERDKQRIPALLVKKTVKLHDRPISVDEIMACSGKRLVVVNQVKRAQSLYLNLAEKVSKSTPLICLHSRFLECDRDVQRQRILEIMGKHSPSQDAIVIATQVVEVGLDISADYLMTELAPANSIVQRAGRCARYGGDGEVNVYQLPEEERNWLPYGTPSCCDNTLSGTHKALGEIESLSFESSLSLVDCVHKIQDKQALAMGLDERLRELGNEIIKHNFCKINEGIGHYIRDADLSVNMIIERNDNFHPSERQGVRVSLDTLRSFVRRFPHSGLKVWTYDDEGNGFWKKVEQGTEAVGFHFLVSPELANYSPEWGLILGEPGNHISPYASPPERPGYAPPGRELWADHAKRVAEYIEKRPPFKGGFGDTNGLLVHGLRNCYEIEAGVLKEAVDFAAKAHDLGKLQEGWQSWANEIECSCDPMYKPQGALAHTSGSGVAKTTKPRHALQSAYIAYQLLCSLHEDWPEELCLAVITAIASHHGGWVYPDPKIQNLCGSAQNAIKAVFGDVNVNFKRSDFTEFVRALNKSATDANRIRCQWPLTSFIIRMLRLSDREATAEGGSNE